jgi:chromosome segregation ATPase
MPKITDTYQLAYACCETILKELNRFPTIDLIRERIGVNSPNTIKKAMNDWTAEFAKQYIEQQQAGRICPEVPSVLTDAVSRLWQDTVQAAAQIADEKLKKLKSTITDLQKQVEQQQNTIQAASQTLASTNEKLATAETETAELSRALRQLQDELLESQKREQAIAQALEAQCQQQENLTAQHAERLQQEQAWMQRRIVEEREMASEKWEGKQQQLEEQIAYLKAQAEQAMQSQLLSQGQNRQRLDVINALKNKDLKHLLPYYLHIGLK